MAEPKIGRRPRAAWWLSCLFILGVALAARAYELDGQSFWNDEGTSVALAGRSLAAITRDASHDIHPPLYYYLLHFWVRLFGASEIAVRGLSALLGSLTAVLVWLLGRRFLSREAAWTAALVTIVSPFQVYYSQEARMYILVTFLGALSFWFFAAWMERLFDRQSARRSLGVNAWGYVLCGALMMYSHYFAFTLIVAQNLLFAGRWLWAYGQADHGAARRYRWSIMGKWVVSQLVIVMAFAPWLIVVWRQVSHWPAVSEPFGLPELAKRVLNVFNLGLSMEHSGWWALAFGALLAGGWTLRVCQMWRQRAPFSAVWGALIPWAYWLTPVALIFLLSVQRPMYNPKFLLLASPGYALLLGQALMAPFEHPWLRWLWRMVATALVVGVSLLSLWQYHTDPSYARDDYRSIARYIEAVEGAADAILINAPAQIETFDYYYQGRSPIYPLPQQRPIDTAVTEGQLREMVAGRSHIYAILWATDESDPERFIEGWLDQHIYKAADTWYGNVRLAVYAVPKAEPQPEAMRQIAAQFGQKIRLDSYAVLTLRVASGDILQLALRWRAESPIESRYKVFVHLLDGQELIVGQRDAEPGGGALITPIWPVGETIIDNHGVLVLPATPPGTYGIALGMYDLNSGTRLPISLDGESAGDRLLLDTVQVVAPASPPPLVALGMHHTVGLEVDGLELLGYNLPKLGHEHAPEAPLHAGDILSLTLFWQVREALERELVWRLGLEAADGTVAWQTDLIPLHGDYPMSDWNRGQIIRDQQRLFLPATLAPGRYRLRLGALSAQDGASVVSSQRIGTIILR